MKSAESFALASRADQVRVRRRGRKHLDGGVDRHEALAAFDEADERTLLRRRDRGVIAVDQQAVVVGEDLRGQRFGWRGDVRELDAVPREHRARAR